MASSTGIDGSGLSLPTGLQPASVDIVTAIYVLSALHPNELRTALRNLCSVCALPCLLPPRRTTGDVCWPDQQALKPGGLLLIRDYARHDLAQLRIKGERLLDPDVPNLYIRGDGTRVYFFDKEDLGAALREHGLEVEQLEEDRRLVSTAIGLPLVRVLNLTAREPEDATADVPDLAASESAETISIISCIMRILRLGLCFDIIACSRSEGGTEPASSIGRHVRGRGILEHQAGERRGCLRLRLRSRCN